MRSSIDHAERQRVERGGTVQRDEGDVIADLAEYFHLLRAAARSSVLPHRLALLEECFDAFALVGAVEQVHESLALQRQRGGARRALTRLMDRAAC